MLEVWYDCLMLLLIRRSPGYTLFPYTTLFRSRVAPVHREGAADARRGVLREEALELREVPQRVPRSVLTEDRKSTRLNSSHLGISYAVLCLKKKALRLIIGREGQMRCALEGDI